MYKINDDDPAETCAQDPKNIKSAWNASELLEYEFPVQEWYITGFITDGLTLISGAPKIGKSWMVLSIAMELSVGGRVFDAIEVDETEVLYLALEDTPRRLKDRLIKIEAEKTTKLHIECSLDAWEGDIIKCLEYYLDKYPEIEVIIIDPLGKIRKDSEENSYQKSYKELEPIKTLADKKGISIVLIHHTRKGNGNIPTDKIDDILGSRALSAACDTLIMIERHPNSSQGAVYIRGRDVEEKSYRMAFLENEWRLVGDGVVRLTSPEQIKICDYIARQNKPQKINDIASGLGMEYRNVKSLLSKMAKRGELTRTSRGEYQIPNGYNGYKTA